MMYFWTFLLTFAFYDMYNKLTSFIATHHPLRRLEGKSLFDGTAEKLTSASRQGATTALLLGFTRKFENHWFNLKTLHLLRLYMFSCKILSGK